ncbi:hypothetical protein [Kamptonema formosum]|uniref:hypothetical protein n=1 Tax=Kamptonema formosum TaxID=331992 RepID=UPI00035DB99A|nr:hypothetical protein [Oscillatoria sp. PCC 10802]
MSEVFPDLSNPYISAFEELQDQHGTGRGGALSAQGLGGSARLLPHKERTSPAPSLAFLGRGLRLQSSPAVFCPILIATGRAPKLRPC